MNIQLKLFIFKIETDLKIYKFVKFVDLLQ